MALPKQSAYQGGALFPINRSNDDGQSILFSDEPKTYWPVWPPITAIAADTDSLNSNNNN